MEEKSCLNCVFEYFCKWNDKLCCNGWKSENDEKEKERLKRLIKENKKPGGNVYE